MGSSWENVDVDNSKMRVYLSQPETSRPAPAVIVVQGQTGVDDFLKFSDMVAREGFIAAAPDLYHRDRRIAETMAEHGACGCAIRTVIQDVNARGAFSSRTSPWTRARSASSVSAWAGEVSI